MKCGHVIQSIERALNSHHDGCPSVSESVLREALKILSEKSSERASQQLADALRFYADPFAWKALYDQADTVHIPDFYSETSFGDIAVKALAFFASQGTPALTSKEG